MLEFSMAISLVTNNINYEIGNFEFLFAFFSTVSHHLEKNSWGSRFPVLMNELYQGKVSPENLSILIQEIGIVQEELRNFEPKEVIWNIEDLTKRPPWGDKISTEITSLANYFVTSDGKDLFEVLNAAVTRAKSNNTILEIK
jgi:hypothetical protein